MSYVLGLDLGTSSLKGLVVNKNGKVIETCSSDYPIIQEKTGYSEQKPHLWIEACVKVINELSEKIVDFKDQLQGISFSGQMHSLVLLDKNNQVLRPAILWNDVRTTEECEHIMLEFGDELLEKTRNKALEGFTLPKILWVKKNEPEIWNNVAHLMLPKDYLGYWMTDSYHMDMSDAAGTLLLNIYEKKWDKDILKKFSIEDCILPELVTSTDEIGSLRKELKVMFGLKNDVKVFAGGADNACAAIGSGILNEEMAMVSIGTSGVFLAYQNEEAQGFKGKIHLFNHAIRDKYYSMGVTLSAGHSLTWFRDTFANDLDFETLLDEVVDVLPGAEGLLFTPYITGERTPYADSHIRGSFIGVDSKHKLKHFTRAVLEGITYSLKDSQLLLEEKTNKKFSKVVTIGGGAKNKEWQQIQADIFNTEIVTLRTEQGPGLGAAMIAAVGLKWFKDMENCAHQFVTYGESIFPNKENVKLYEKYYPIYRKIYSHTQDICHELLT